MRASTRLLTLTLLISLSYAQKYDIRTPDFLYEGVRIIRIEQNSLYVTPFNRPTVMRIPIIDIQAIRHKNMNQFRRNGVMVGVVIGAVFGTVLGTLVRAGFVVGLSSILGSILFAAIGGFVGFLVGFGSIPEKAYDLTFVAAQEKVRIIQYLRSQQTSWPGF